VLNDDFKLAAKFVEKIGSKSEYISEEGYRLWPIFREFRKSQEFLDAFESAFGKKFDVGMTEEEIAFPRDLGELHVDELN
jgi:hypothetical protein